MKIYTSYFANWRKFPDNAVPISIARFAAPGWKGLRYEVLAPWNELLILYKNGEIDEKEFKREFSQYLRLLDQEEVVNELRELSGGKDVILCCYEKRGEFCHRNLVREWLNGEELGN